MMTTRASDHGLTSPGTVAVIRERCGVSTTSDVMAQRPGILRAAKQLGAAIDRSGLLPKDLVALVNLRVALINGCPF